MRKAELIRFLTLGALATLAAGALPAETNVGVINMQRAVLETAEIKKASADLESKYKPRQEEMQKLQRDLQAIQQQLQAGADKLTPEAQADLTRQGQFKQRQLQRMSEDLQADVDRERNEILTRSGAKMTAVVQKLAEEKGLDVVIEITNTVFFKAALDVTADAIAAFDKAHPVQ
jgi:outer membrane protein